MKNIKMEAPCTAVIAAVNVIVFFVLSFGGMTEDAGYMLSHGAMYVPYITERGEWYRLFTSMCVCEHLDRKSSHTPGRRYADRRVCCVSGYVGSDLRGDRSASLCGDSQPRPDRQCIRPGNPVHGDHQPLLWIYQRRSGQPCPHRRPCVGVPARRSSLLEEKE